MKTEPTKLTLEDLALIVSDGDIEGELQKRIANVIRSDSRFAEQFEQLEALAADAGTDDLWDGFERNREFDRLLEAESWNDPAEVLNPDASELYEVSYRRLLAIADARIARTEHPGLIQSVKDRLLRAEEKSADRAVYQVAEALKNLSVDTAEKVIVEVRRKYWREERADDE